MKKKLSDYLVCPDCGSEFKLRVERIENDEIMDGVLFCLGCSKEYHIIRGIPRLVKGNQNTVSKRTTRNFGYSWLKVWKLNKADELEAGSYFSGLLNLIDIKDKLILDAGCGNGRITYFLGKHTQRDIIGFDLSDSVEAAFENTRNFANIHIIQADIYNLPFKKQFDFIYSIGVLHHLPQPQEAFDKLVNLLNKSGEILVWVYGREGNRMYLRLFEPFRALTCRLPLFVDKILAAILAGVFWVIIKLFYLSMDRKGRIDRLPLGKYLMFFYRLGFRQFMGTVFDKMIAPISNYYTKEEFMTWFQDSGLRDIKVIERNGNSWKGLGKTA